MRTKTRVWRDLARRGALLVLVIGISTAATVLAQPVQSPTISSESGDVCQDWWRTNMSEWLQTFEPSSTNSLELADSCSDWWRENWWRMNLPEWLQRLENPVDAIGFDFVDLILDGHRTVTAIQQQVEGVKSEVEEVIREADIWNIDLGVDVPAIRIVRALKAEEKVRILTQGIIAPSCPVPELTEHDASMVEHRREVCLCFINRDEAELAAEIAVTEIAESEEGLTSNSALWQGMGPLQERLRETMPFRTVTLQETEERIELWIGSDSACTGATSVRVKWTNIPG